MYSVKNNFVKCVFVASTVMVLLLGTAVLGQDDEKKGNNFDPNRLSNQKQEDKDHQRRGDRDEKLRSDRYHRERDDYEHFSDGPEDGNEVFKMPPDERKGPPKDDKGNRDRHSSWRMMHNYREYMEWLKKNQPEKAQELEELREENPGLFMRKLRIGWHKYGRIVEASEDNPELAQLLLKDMDLKEQRNSIIEEIKKADNEEEKQQLKTELRNVLEQRFNLIVQRKQLEYENLLERLRNLEEEVKQSKQQVKKWQTEEFKNNRVSNRLEELLSEKQPFRWK